MTMPPDTVTQLITAIREFTTSKHKFTLRKWQRLAGWINWSLNIFPLLRPALNNFYAKISGKSAPNKFVRINNAVRADLEWATHHLEWAAHHLEWAAHHLECDSGVRLIHQIYWDADSANFTIFCDACLEGLGFWLPDDCVGFYSPTPVGSTEEHIFFLEALCVLSAIHHITDVLHAPPMAKALIYTDNDNTVAIFNTLQ